MGHGCQDWPGLQMETRHPKQDRSGAAPCWPEDVGRGTARARALWGRNSTNSGTSHQAGTVGASDHGGAGGTSRVRA